MTAPAVPPLPGPLVEPGWLAEHLGSDGLVVLDASVGAHCGSGQRLPGARRFDLDGEMSDQDAPLPHTLPGPRVLAARLRALGLNDGDTAVVYDAAGVYSSARAWWMLRAAGHDRAAVLDGGLPAWAAAGLPVEEEPAARYAGPGGDFAGRPRAEVFTDAAGVEAALAERDRVVLDARSRGRFAGTQAEPRPGLRPGHMPGSVNLPFTELQSDGRMLPPDQLRTAFHAAAGGHDRLIVSCGSGVTACVLALGAHLVGIRDVSVYDGSWSEWGRPDGPPAVTGP